MSILTTGYIEIIWKKLKKIISKMAEPSENGVRIVVFLTEVDFSV